MNLGETHISQRHQKWKPAWSAVSRSVHQCRIKSHLLFSPPGALPLQPSARSMFLATFWNFFCCLLSELLLSLSHSMLCVVSSFRTLVFSSSLFRQCDLRDDWWLPQPFVTIPPKPSITSNWRSIWQQEVSSFRSSWHRVVVHHHSMLLCQVGAACTPCVQRREADLVWYTALSLPPSQCPVGIDHISISSWCIIMARNHDQAPCQSISIQDHDNKQCGVVHYCILACQMPWLCIIIE